MTPLPANDEVEVTVLGPGRGESVLIHVGNGEWLVVDSCVTSSGDSAPLAYLASLDVDFLSVRWVLATHWHDDHIRGFATLTARCTAAEIVQSIALEHDEFLRLALSSAESMMAGPSGVREMARTLQVLRNQGRPKPRFVQADLRLHHSGPGVTPVVEIWVLSPSSASVAEALVGFSALAASQGGPKHAAPRPLRNPSSVVLWVKVGSTRILLGADLENAADPAKGWQAVIGASGRPTDPCHFVKVPHHGSKDAHHEGMWTELLVHEPRAALTPFVSGRVNLPRSSDIERIVSRTSTAWLTRSGAVTGPRKRPRAVERTIGEVVRSIRTISIDPGRVTFRCPALDPSGVVVDAPPPAVFLSA